MDSSAPAAVPWIVLGMALLALAGLTGTWLLRGRGRSEGPHEIPPPTPRPPAPRWTDDDLPGFLDAPPGTRAPSPPPPAEPAPAAEAPVAGTRDPGAGRVVAAMSATALLLVGALAVVAAGADDDGTDTPATSAPASSPAGPTGATEPTTPPPPQLPGVPADPLPGEGGAGVLASWSVPLSPDGASVRLAFGGIVVERHAVGVTVAYPSVSVSTTGDGSAALAHVRLPTWNCMTDQAPADPEDAGCARSTTEYADLPAPALAVTQDGEELRISGRFPTYVRPIGTAPTYTGRVYELTVTAAPASRVREGRATAEGTLFLGTDRVGTLDDDALNVIRYAG